MRRFNSKDADPEEWEQITEDYGEDSFETAWTDGLEIEE